MSEKKEVSNKINEIREILKTLNLSEVSDLIEGVKEDFNIEETVMVQSAVSAQSNEDEKPQEKGGNVSVKFIKIKEGMSPIVGYGAVKEVHKKLKGEEINIIQAKKLTEKEDKILFEDVARDKAEEIKKELIEKGVEVEIK